jgi:Outer membrane lipoprotein-sorting protein
MTTSHGRRRRSEGPPASRAGRAAALPGRHAGRRAATTLLLLMLAVLAPASARGAELTAREVMVRMRAERTATDEAVSVFRLALISRDGTEVTRTVASYQKRCNDAARNLIFFRAPADVAGTGLLTWTHADRPPDMWLYLPDLGRVRQMNASARGGSFMDSDFSFEDLGPVPVEARTHRLAGIDQVDGQVTYKIESTPRGPDAYGRVVTWVSRTTFLPVRIAYYDLAGSFLKVGRFGDVRAVNGIPTPFLIEMENVQTGHRTRLTLLQADYDAGLDCDLFTKRRLARGP